MKGEFSVQVNFSRFHCITVTWFISCFQTTAGLPELTRGSAVVMEGEEATVKTTCFPKVQHLC